MPLYEIARYRASLLSDDVVERRAIARTLAELAMTQHADFVRLCRDLQEAFPVLYAASIGGERSALVGAARQARTETQRQQALQLSRVWLFSKIYAQRDEALRALRLLSTAQAEEDVLLQAYLTYGDELVVWAIGGASACMLPILRNLLARWPVGCAEYNDVRGAIRRLKSRLDQSDHATPFKGQRALDDYL